MAAGVEFTPDKTRKALFHIKRWGVNMLCGISSVFEMQKGD
jgi:hypothetical protein